MEHVLGFALSDLGQTFLFDNLDSSGHPHTTEYLDLFKFFKPLGKALYEVQSGFTGQ